MRILPCVIFAALLCGFAVCAAVAQPSPPPNIVLIISDDQHYGDYGFMGSDIIATPRIDQLAEESLVFRRGYVSTSICCPSLAAMITGQYPHRSGITGNLVNPLHEQQAVYIDMMKQAPALPRILGEHNYLSLQTGKWWHGHWSNGGFTHGMSHGEVARGGRHGDEGLTIGRTGMGPIPGFIDQAQAQGKPFMIWYAPFLPHTPHNPPQRLLDKYKDKTASLPIAKYWAMCEWFDESCGELLDLLDEKGVAENTIILYICDNGWINQPNTSRFAPRSKRSPFDGGLRTPIMIRWPGHIEPGEADGIATNLDLLPTALDAAGIELPDNIDGVSLLDPANRGRESFYSAVFSHDAVDIEDPAANVLYRWCIDGKWKMIEPSSERLPDEQVMLFDILADPTEQHNLAAEHPDLVRTLRGRMDQWWDPFAE